MSSALRTWTNYSTTRHELEATSINHLTVCLDWDVSSVTSFEKTFKNANAFKGTNLYNWDVSSATNMHGMFEHAESFVARISGWNVGKVKTMATMFQNAFAL